MAEHEIKETMEETKATEEVIIETKPSRLDKVKDARPIKWVRRHAKAIAVGAGSAAAVIGVGIAAMKLADAELSATPLDSVADTIEEAVETVSGDVS